MSLNFNNQKIIALNENNLKGVITAREEVNVPFDYCEIQCSEDYFNVQYIVSSCADINKGISANTLPGLPAGIYAPLLSVPR